MSEPLPAEKIAVALLAGGLSSRFSDGDKLLARLNGKPLIQHATDVICGLKGVSRLAIVAPGKPLLMQQLNTAGFSVIPTDSPPHGMGYSIAKAAAAAIEIQAEALLICLADMPFVTVETLQRLVTALTAQPDTTIAVCGDSKINKRQTPPVLFRRCHFRALTRLTGDNGAKALIQNTANEVVTISLPPGQWRDFDTNADFHSV